MNQKKILVKAYAATNLGDDLFLKILTNRYPEVEFTLLGGNRQGIYNRFSSYRLLPLLSDLIRKLLLVFNKTIAKKFTYKAINKRLKKSSTDYDASLLLGGSMFIQNHSGFMENDIVKTSLLSFKHSFVVGANFGPYLEDEYLTKYRDYLSKCEGVTFRDRYSYELLGRLSNSMFCPDVVFQLSPSKSKMIPNTVGFSVIDLSQRGNLSIKQEAYLKLLIDIAKSLIKDDKIVYLFSFCKIEGDEQVVEVIADAVGRNKINVVNYRGDIDKFLEIYSSMECMFCSRFHAMILSLIYSQRMVPLVYSKKMTQVLDDISYTGKLIDINFIEDYDALQAIDMLYKSQYELPESIVQESEDMFKFLDKFIKK